MTGGRGRPAPDRRVAGRCSGHWRRRGAERVARLDDRRVAGRCSGHWRRQGWGGRGCAALHGAGEAAARRKPESGYGRLGRRRREQKCRQGPPCLLGHGIYVVKVDFRLVLSPLPNRAGADLRLPSKLVDLPARAVHDPPKDLGLDPCLCPPRLHRTALHASAIYVHRAVDGVILTLPAFPDAWPGRRRGRCRRMLPPRHGAQCPRAVVLPRGCPWRGGRFRPILPASACANRMCRLQAGRVRLGRTRRAGRCEAGWHVALPCLDWAGQRRRPAARLEDGGRGARCLLPLPQPPAGRCRALRRKAPRQAYFSSHTAAARPRVKYRPAGRAP